MNQSKRRNYLIQKLLEEQPQYAHNWRNAFYVCINKGEADIPGEIREKSVGIDVDIAEVLYLCNSWNKKIANDIQNE